MLPRLSSSLPYLLAITSSADEGGDVGRLERRRQRPVGGVAAGAESARCRRCRAAASRRPRPRPASVKVAGIITVTPCTFGKPPQRHPLVGDAVLHAEDRLLRDAGRAQPLQRRQRVLRLHGQQDRVVRPPVDLRRDRPRRETAPAPPPSGRPQQQPPVADRVELRAPRDPDDLLPRQRQRRRHRPADRPDAVDDDPHRDLPRNPAPRATLADVGRPGQASDRPRARGLPRVPTDGIDHVRPQRMPLRHVRMIEVAAPGRAASRPAASPPATGRGSDR